MTLISNATLQIFVFNCNYFQLLLLLLGAFIGSYGKIIDYWFSDTDKDKMLVQKMDEEDGVSLSNTGGAAESSEEELG